MPQEVSSLDLDHVSASWSVDETIYRNNVIYNWGGNSAYGGEKQQQGNARFDSATINMVANYYKPGPATRGGEVACRIISPSSRRGADDFGKWYVAINPQTAEEAYRWVLDRVGASLPKRDIIDTRIVDETRKGYATYGGATYKGGAVPGESIKCGIIDSQTDVGGWPELQSLPAPPDSDGDGLPDAWEQQHGLNAHDAADGPQDANGDGYTNVEDYLNSLVRW